MYYKNLYYPKLENLKQLNLDADDLPKLNQDEII